MGEIEDPWTPYGTIQKDVNNYTRQNDMIGLIKKI